MWEAIRANRRRSWLLIGLMSLLLVGLGTLIGGAFAGEPGLPIGAAVAVGIWALLLAMALGGGERLILLSTGAREVSKEDSPRLWNVVEEMTIASGLGSMPGVHVIDSEMPNAFAAGRSPESAVVAVTTGLIKRLNRDELQGVIAHEIAHIKNLDVRFMTIASVMVGSIVMLADSLMRVLWFGGGRRSSRDSGQGQAIFMVAAIVAAIVAPIAAQLLYFAVSRKREYLADASAARFTRYPAGLAGALAKIASAGMAKEKSRWRAVAPMFIVNPLQAAGGSTGWFSTHPPTARRIAVLEAMAGTAGWSDYEKAFESVVGGATPVLDRSLTDEPSLPARAATAEPEPKAESIDRAREMIDLVDRMAGLLLIPCACGVRIKVPPELDDGEVACPRCGRHHTIPEASPGEPAERGAAPTADRLRYTRRGPGWESFRCACGGTQQLSPSFAGDSIQCPRCSRTTEILPPAP